MKKQPSNPLLPALFLCLLLTSGCKEAPKLQDKEIIEQTKQEEGIHEATRNENIVETPQATEETFDYINETGTCLKERINVPEGFARLSYEENSFGAFLENYPLCVDGQPVLLYDGSEKVNQSAHVAVFDMEVTDGDLQQCADSIIRMYAEYFYEQKQYEKMKFHFVNGFSCDFDKWSRGMRVKVDGNETSWYRGADADDSEEILENYLRMVFSYGSTLSMEQESKPVKSSEIQVGDIFIRGGSPGHVVMVVDVCENEKGEKAFLLAQGYMPAQQFHVLRNPGQEDNPWYYETELSYPFLTPEYSFEEGSLRRPEY